MCGIAGDLRFDGSPSNPDALQAMAEVMAPRGPDGSGMISRGAAGFAHRRLKIIDLSDAGQQPMEDPELGLTLAFNGCIYNHKALREELEKKGYRFFSTSDTEVILKAYHAWGPDCVQRFNGMFAFAIRDRESGQTMLARDRMGIKPLYLAETDGGLRFASSLPALLAAGGSDRTINPVALHHYFSFHSVIPAPHTLFKGIQKLPPATILVVSADGSRQQETYWQPGYDPVAGEESLTAEDWKDRIETELRAAVRRRLVADVPVGVLLSGGLDSSLIVGLLAEAGATGLNTFSIGFETVGEEKGDEFEYSDIVAQHFGTRHHQIPVETSRALPALSRAIGAMSEPMTSHDCVGFYLLSEEVSRHVKVVQSGQGADEIFTGYHWYPPMVGANDPLATYKKAFFDRDQAEMARLIPPEILADDPSTEFVRQHFAHGGASEPVDKALRLDSHIMLVDDPVKRVGNMTMAHGLEARVPFLDHELVEVAARCPADLKMADGGKGILKTIARDHIPAAVIDRPKGYFPMPALKYLRGPYLEMVRDAVHATAFKDRGLVNPDYVETLLKAPEDHITPLRGSKLWQVGVLALWLDQHDRAA